MSIPATSDPSERVFSKTGQIINERRNRLLPKNLDYIIFLNSNLNIFLNLVFYLLIIISTYLGIFNRSKVLTVIITYSYK